MKKILLISNSFGVDATRYLYGIARKGGEDVSVACLFIGGCPLSRHYRNMISEEKAYQLYYNGASTPFRISLADALLADDWDIVTFQQASPASGDYSSYMPYLTELSAYVKELVPQAKQYIHAIWAWSDARIAKSEKEVCYASSADMFAADKIAYKKAAYEINADGFIPATEAMEKLYLAIGDATYRDGAHASNGVGRYMLGLVWYMTIFGKDIEGINYRDFDVAVSDEEIAIAEKIAREVVAENDYKQQ